MAMVIFTLLLLLLLPFVAAQWPVCGNSGNYTSNSTYLANLGLLSATLPKKAASEATQLFATDTVGHAPDTVFALTLCYGNTTAEVCEGCVVTAFQDGQQLCAYNKDATLYYDECMLRYSIQPEFSQQHCRRSEMGHAQQLSELPDKRLLLQALIVHTSE
jgi:hypothetical protein